MQEKSSKKSNEVYSQGFWQRLKDSIFYAYGKKNQTEIGQILGVGKSTVSGYKNDNLPKTAILFKIFELTGADLHWLMTGQNAGQVPVKKSQLAGSDEPEAVAAPHTPKTLEQRVENLEREVGFISGRENYNALVPIATELQCDIFLVMAVKNVSDLLDETAPGNLEIVAEILKRLRKQDVDDKSQLNTTA